MKYSQSIRGLDTFPSLSILVAEKSASYNFWTGSTGKRWWNLRKTFLKTNGSKLQYCISLDFGVERICFTIGKLYQLLSLCSENNFNHRRIIASKGRTKNFRWIYTTSIWHSDHSTNFPSKGGRWYPPKKNGFLSTSWFVTKSLGPLSKASCWVPRNG